jgi:aminomethyltransferase
MPPPFSRHIAFESRGNHLASAAISGNHGNFSAPVYPLVEKITEKNPALGYNRRRLVIIDGSPMSSTSFSGKLAGSGARFAMYAGAEAPLAFASPQAEFRALRGGSALLDLSWRAKLVLTGEDRSRWLNGMVTNNTRDLPLNQGNYSFVLNAQGRIQGDLVAYNRGDYFLLSTDREQVRAMREFFDRHIIMDDVEVTDISEKLASIAVVGPASRQLLDRAGVTLPELQPYQVHNFVWNGIGLTAARGPALVAGFEFWMHPDNAALLWDGLLAAGAVAAGTVAWEWLLISLGLPRFGIDIRERDLPQETGQQHALHFAKGCYVGQEIVERIRSRGNVHRVFAGFRVQGAAPRPGAKIECGGQPVGEITSAASIPALAAEDSAITLALGYIRREAAAPGTEVKIGPDLARVESLPFSI